MSLLIEPLRFSVLPLSTVMIAAAAGIIIRSVPMVLFPVTLLGIGGDGAVIT
jgi:hypothetical protein